MREPSNVSPSEVELKPLVFAKSPMSEAIRAEVARLCEVGDLKAGGAFTAELCSRIARVVKAGRDLILTEKVTGLSDLVRRKRRQSNIMYSNGDTGEDITDEVIDGSTDEFMSSGSVMGSMSLFNNENFGMTALRELIGMARGFNDSPEKIVAALAVARENKLDDVAAALSVKLGLGPVVAVPETESHTPGWREPDVVLQTKEERTFPPQSIRSSKDT